MIIASTAVLLVAHIVNMCLAPCAPDEQCYSGIAPLVLIGIGYSLYAAALWGSIPYVVEARTVGTAFGFCTAIQNAGMAIAPTIVGSIIDATASDSSHGYFWASAFFAGVCIVGIVLNVWLYIEDIRNNNGQLNKVHRGDAIEDLINSPTGGERKKLEIEQNTELDERTKIYLLRASARDALKRSIAKRSMAK